MPNNSTLFHVVKDFKFRLRIHACITEFLNGTAISSIRYYQSIVLLKLRMHLKTRPVAIEKSTHVSVE